MSDEAFVGVLWIVGGALFIALVLHNVGRHLERSSQTWLSHEQEPDPIKREAFSASMRAREKFGEKLMLIAARIYIPIGGSIFLLGLGLH